ncbi:apolipoprotein N-acyltransferase [soil metagenome]
MADTLLVTDHTAPTPRSSGIFWLRAATCLLFGSLLSAAFPPVGVWPTVFGLIVLFALVARSPTSREAFAPGFWFGLGFFASHLFWLPNSLSDPNLFGPVAWVMYPPIVLIEGVFWGIVTGGSRFLGRRGAGTLLFLPALWLLMAWASTQGVFAFPWGSLGYVWLGTPLAQFADVSGSYGLSFVTLVVTALLAVPFLGGGRRAVFASATSVLVAALLTAGVSVYSRERLAEPVPVPNQQALLVQGNTDPLERAQGTSSDLDIYAPLTARALQDLPVKPGLVVWPEGAVLGFNVEIEGVNGEETRRRIQNSAGDAAVITGAGVGSYNSVYGLSDATITGRYDKVYLVPFGEGIPFNQALLPVYTVVYGWFNLGPYGRLPGTAFNPIPTSAATAATYVCYESVFPQVAWRMVARGADVLVNISNDAWFGRGNGAEQHFAMGTMRAIETRRYLLRVGNDGVTAVVDPQGRTLQRLERHIPASLLADYATSDVVTLYVRYGDWLIVAVAVYALLLAALLLPQRSRMRREQPL